MASDASLVEVISHEIAHSIDPCNSGMPFWEIDQEKFNELLNDPNFKTEKKILTSFISTDSKFINYDLSLFINNENFLNKLIAIKAVRKIQDGIPAEKYPFKEEADCFLKHNKIRENSKENISLTKKYLKKYSSLYKEKFLNDMSVERYFTALDKHPQCLNGITPVSQINETVPDMFGALVEEKFILENPFKSEVEKVAA
ncbi:MAG: hypothetical protein ACXVCP_07655 [Bdellovibrio sp.]